MRRAFLLSHHRSNDTEVVNMTPCPCISWRGARIRGFALGCTGTGHVTDVLTAVGPYITDVWVSSVRRYGMFDTLKQRHARRTGREPGVLPALSYGVASAFMGQLSAFPLETVSRRLQMQCGPAGSNFQQMLRQIVREEGSGALYRGLGAASMRVVPMACVSFGTYECVHAWLARLDASEAAVTAPASALNAYCGTLQLEEQL